MPEFIEKQFEKAGRWIARKPWIAIAISVVLVAICAGGYPSLKTENRAEMQWVPRGALGLTHKDYADEMWPSSNRFNFWMAQCTGSNCNALDAAHMKELNRIHQEILAITVTVEEVKNIHTVGGNGKKSFVWEKLTDKQWEVFNGSWSFDRSKDRSTKRKCVQFGPFCGKSSPLEIFREDTTVINTMTDKESLDAFNFWESQTTACPVTIAKSDSPCVDASKFNSNASKQDCQTYNTTDERKNCRIAADEYCKIKCPPPYNNCADNGCPSLAAFNQLAANSNNNNSAPDSAFAFEPFKISTVASSGKDGPIKKNGEYESATTLFGFYALAATPVLVDGSDEDPVALEWEKRALCKMGIVAETLRGIEEPECKGSDMFDFKAQFTRSLSDEFGNAIRGDVAALGASYFLIIIYMGIMLSRRDHVHSMVFMSLVTVAIVGMSYIGAMGLGSYIGLMNNNLNAQIPFLLLGLGVDDAFVLSSEFVRATTTLGASAPIEDRVAMAVKSGGMSILITSATDALAFFFGSITVLPALSWFCVFAGFGVLLCFIFQITFFVPFLVLNERRALQNRYDMSCFPLCCFKANQRLDKLCCIKPQQDNSPANKAVGAPDDAGASAADVDFHDWDSPRGCCFCCNCKPGGLVVGFERFGRMITTPVGKITTFVVFLSMLIVGIVGAFQIKQDFKLEWFVPDDSYLNTFFKWNSEFFATGTPITIYVKDIDYFSSQGTLIELKNLMTSSKLVDHPKGYSDWYGSFIDTTNGDANSANWGTWLNSDKTQFKSKTDFYKELHAWYIGGGGARFRSSIKWVDNDCNSDDYNEPLCDPQKGVLATKMGCTLTLEATDDGQTRYDTMTALRKDIAKIVPDEKAFPYSFQFLYWEETGVIGKELVQNLLSCGAVIIVLICAMIPHPRIAPFVVGGIIYSVVTLVGFMHWWGITVSGVSTIYILISIGLAVDYSAHVAHMFVESTGMPEDRAVAALKRIGPSVFNAIGSTLLAVCVLGFSKSYIFRVFFKALFLTVLFGGAVGLWLLPVMLSVFGGTKEKGNNEGGESPRSNQVTTTKQIEMKNIEEQKDESKAKETV
jgi:predicted RND superfamily exporter protein